jgi:DNA-binding response OmpR family regulator
MTMGKFESMCRVLLVDDQEPMRLLLAQFIRQDLRAQITLAGTCEAALRLAGRNAYDVILLDLLMPGIGGFELLGRIRSGSPNKSTPVVLLGDETLSAERVTALGADAVVSRPVRRRALVSAVRAQLRASVDSTIARLNPSVNS